MYRSLSNMHVCNWLWWKKIGFYYYYYYVGFVQFNANKLQRTLTALLTIIGCWELSHRYSMFVFVFVIGGKVIFDFRVYFSEKSQFLAGGLVLSWWMIGRPPHGVLRQWAVVVRYGMRRATGASLSSWFLKAAGLTVNGSRQISVA